MLFVNIFIYKLLSLDSCLPTSGKTLTIKLAKESILIKEKLIELTQTLAFFIIQNFKFSFSIAIPKRMPINAYRKKIVSVFVIKKKK